MKYRIKLAPKKKKNVLMCVAGKGKLVALPRHVMMLSYYNNGVPHTHYRSYLGREIFPWEHYSSPLDSISPSRGIRQGDPLFPYIFILCVDYLSQLIEEKCNNKIWSPVKASRSGAGFFAPYVCGRSGSFRKSGSLKLLQY